MHTKLSPEFATTADGEEAAAIVGKCVHCGFCNATCPTYQLLGDELDGPRGRIYLIKQVLEGAPVTRSTQQHLDRCLTCLNCQTTCPSGVEYGHLVEIGRQLVEERVSRPPTEKAVRWLLKEGLTSPLFGSAMSLGQAVRPLLPQILRDKVPPRPSGTPQGVRIARGPAPGQKRRVLMLKGCVQPSMMPNIDAATMRVFALAGIEAVYAGAGGCCGALRTHLSDRAGGLADMRHNIDAWIPLLARGDVEAIVSTASACGLALKEYAHAFSEDSEYAEKAARVSAVARDLSEFLPDLVPALKDRVRPDPAGRVAFHAPCTLQHGQGLRDSVETPLRALGFNVTAAGNESHLCCGSAGTYSMLQPSLAKQLRDRKLANLAKLEPDSILSANVGCIQHLQAGTATRVMHWIELLDRALV
jgi:glycolate oxidase iron-sulfur subunit